MSLNATLDMEDDVGNGLILNATSMRLDTSSTISMYGDSAINIASGGNFQAYASGVHMKGSSSFDASAAFSQIGMGSIFVLDGTSTATATFGVDTSGGTTTNDEGELNLFGNAQFWDFPDGIIGTITCDSNPATIATAYDFTSLCGTTTL
ncbi:MAG: hypothetical protein PSN44_09605 [Gammaproteobacteria bacterium]|nr:hypothetical protein [Gammaproteobacteria bacterium]